MPNDARGEVRIVVLLTLAFVLLGLAFAVLVPMFANFDEQTQLDRARYTARHPLEQVGPSLRVTYGSWAALQAVRGAPEPLGVDGAARRESYRAFGDYPGGDAGDPAPCPGVCQNIQYAHPPAWYLLAAPVTAALDGQTFPRTVLVLRVFDVLLVAPMVALAWATAREVWPRSPRRRVAVAAAVALTGPLAYTAANVNNDALLLLTIGGAIALMARILRRGPTVASSAALGAVVALGLLTKVEMVLAAPAIGLAVLAGPADWPRRLRSALGFGLLAAPAALWWLHEVADGGPLTPKSSELLGPAVPGPWTHMSYLRYVLDKAPTLLGRFWGTYNTPVTFVPAPVRVALGVAVLALAAGWLATRRWGPLTAASLRWWLLAAVPVSLALGTLYASVDGYRRDGQLRGLAPRYVYPAAAVLAIGAVAALAAIAGRVVPGHLRRWLLPAGVAVLSLVGGVASVARAVQGSFGTSSWADIADRARAVSPIGRPMEVLAPIALAWVAVLVLAARRMLQLAPDDPRDAPPAHLRRAAPRR
jgi:hypothetical protein